MGEEQASKADGSGSDLQKHENKMKVRQMKISKERQTSKSTSSRKGEPGVTSRIYNNLETRGEMGCFLELQTHYPK